MKNIFFIVSLLFLVFSCKEPGLKEIHYFDGSNNHYSYSNASGILNYDPVTPLESSSGTYSGGEKWQRLLNADEISEMERLFQGIAGKTHDLMDKRVMMSGMIRLVFTDREMMIILSPQSEEKKQVEAFLSRIKNQ